MIPTGMGVDIRLYPRAGPMEAASPLVGCTTCTIFDEALAVIYLMAFIYAIIGIP